MYVYLIFMSITAQKIHWGKQYFTVVRFLHFIQTDVILIQGRLE